MHLAQEYPIYRVSAEVALPEYIKLLFRTNLFRDRINAIISGASGRKRVEPATLEAMEVPLPPLRTQRSILARWQRAQTEIAAARQRVTHQETRCIAEFLSALGVRPPPPVARPKYLAATWNTMERWSVSSVTDAVLGLDALPIATFPYCPLGEIAEVSYGIQKSPANRPGQHPRQYLRVANVRKGHLDLDEIKQINVPDSEMDAYRLQPGDILFVEGNGSRAELGRVAKWSGEIADCVHQNHLIKVRPDASRLLGDFTMAWFNTRDGRSYFFRAAKTSSGLGTINSNEVRRAPIPLPPLATQRQLVERIAAARAEIARERAAAAKLATDTTTQIESLILGTSSP